MDLGVLVIKNQVIFFLIDEFSFYKKNESAQLPSGLTCENCVLLWEWHVQSIKEVTK